MDQLADMLEGLLTVCVLFGLAAVIASLTYVVDYGMNMMFP